MSPSSAISLQSVTKYFYKRDTRITALSNITLDVSPGSFVSILGPSGCGKSTILNLIAGFEEPDVGSVSYGGRPVHGVSVGIGYLTQHDTLLPWRTVQDNVRLPLDIQGEHPSRGIGRGRGGIGRGTGGTGRGTGAEARQRVAWVIELVGLAGFEHHLPRELSGGMRKRAALAQTLVYARDTVLMDEPFGALDFQMRLQLQAELLDIWRAERHTIVFITHDIEEAVTLSDQIVVLSRRPGRIRDVVHVDLPRPRDPVTTRFEPRFRELCKYLWDQVEPPEGASTRPGAAGGREVMGA